MRSSRDAATDVVKDDEINHRMSDCSTTLRASYGSLDAVKQNIAIPSS